MAVALYTENVTTTKVAIFLTVKFAIMVQPIKAVVIFSNLELRA